MSQRVNISVPDSLHLRMQSVKEQINVSAICSESLELAVCVQESINKAEGVKDKMIERLRAERQQSENEWFQAGKQEGIEAAENTSYEAFDLLDSVYGDGNSDPYKAHWSEELWEDEEFEWIKESASNFEVSGLRLKDFYSGIFDGLLEVWQSIKEDVLSKG